jgi:hypothetical protein
MSFFFFYKIGEQEGQTGPAWGVRWLVPVGEGGGGERMQESEYGANTVYTGMQMEK